MVGTIALDTQKNKWTLSFEFDSKTDAEESNAKINDIVNYTEIVNRFPSTIDDYLLAKNAVQKSFIAVTNIMKKIKLERDRLAGTSKPNEKLKISGRIEGLQDALEILKIAYQP